MSLTCEPAHPTPTRAGFFHAPDAPAHGASERHLLGLEGLPAAAIHALWGDVRAG